MRMAVGVLVAFLWSASAFALDFTGSYDVYQAPNVSNNYDDGQGFSIGVRHGIWKDLKGRFDATHISDIDFPAASDPKGSYGELRGYGGVYNLIYDMVYDKKFTISPYAGIGAVSWDFRENPQLQDSQIRVLLEPSLIYKVGVDASYRLRKDWRIEFGVGWMDTNIHKEAIGADGTHHNILDADNNIGLQMMTWKVSVRKRF